VLNSAGRGPAERVQWGARRLRPEEPPLRERFPELDLNPEGKGQEAGARADVNKAFEDAQKAAAAIAGAQGVVIDRFLTDLGGLQKAMLDRLERLLTTGVVGTKAAEVSLAGAKVDKASRQADLVQTLAGAGVKTDADLARVAANKEAIGDLVGKTQARADLEGRFTRASKFDFASLSPTVGGANITSALGLAENPTSISGKNFLPEVLAKAQDLTNTPVSFTAKEYRDSFRRQAEFRGIARQDLPDAIRGGQVSVPELVNGAIHDILLAKGRQAADKAGEPAATTKAALDNGLKGFDVDLLVKNFGQLKEALDDVHRPGRRPHRGGGRRAGQEVPGRVPPAGRRAGTLNAAAGVKRSDPSGLLGGALGASVVGRAYGGAMPARHTDVIPAMLSEGEFVVNSTSTKANRGLLEAINNSHAPMYRADGGFIGMLKRTAGGVADTVKDVGQGVARQLGYGGSSDKSEAQTDEERLQQAQANQASRRGPTYRAFGGLVSPDEQSRREREEEFELRRRQREKLARDQSKFDRAPREDGPAPRAVQPRDDALYPADTDRYQDPLLGEGDVSFYARGAASTPSGKRPQSGRRPIDPTGAEADERFRQQLGPLPTQRDIEQELEGKLRGNDRLDIPGQAAKRLDQVRRSRSEQALKFQTGRDITSFNRQAGAIRADGGRFLNAPRAGFEDQNRIRLGDAQRRATYQQHIDLLSPTRDLAQEALRARVAPQTVDAPFGPGPTSALPLLGGGLVAPGAANQDNRGRAGPGVGPARPGGGAVAAAISPEAVQALQKLGTAFGDSAPQLIQALTGFNTTAQALAEAMKAFPNKLTLEGKQDVNVNINGAEALSGLLPALKEMVTTQTAAELERVMREKFPDAGPGR
jgi:hypothetical protein